MHRHAISKTLQELQVPAGQRVSRKKHSAGPYSSQPPLLTLSTFGNVCMHSGLSHVRGMLLESRVEAMDAAKHCMTKNYPIHQINVVLGKLRKRTREVR